MNPFDLWILYATPEEATKEVALEMKNAWQEAQSLFWLPIAMTIVLGASLVR